MIKEVGRGRAVRRRIGAEASVGCGQSWSSRRVANERHAAAKERYDQAKKTKMMRHGGFVSSFGPGSLATHSGEVVHDSDWTPNDYGNANAADTDGEYGNGGSKRSSGGYASDARSSGYVSDGAIGQSRMSAGSSGAGNRTNLSMNQAAAGSIGGNQGPSIGKNTKRRAQNVTKLKVSSFRPTITTVEADSLRHTNKNQNILNIDTRRGPGGGYAVGAAGAPAHKFASRELFRSFER